MNATAAPVERKETQEQREARERKENRFKPREGIRRNDRAQEVLESAQMKRALENDYNTTRLTWPDGQKLMDAPGPEEIARILIAKFHREIADYKILFLFKERMKTRGRVVLGKASKADPKLAFFTEATFVLELNHEAWVFMPVDAKLALIDHELEHFGVEETESGEKEPVLNPHDLEEFVVTVQRWGLWKQDVQKFSEAVQLALPLSNTEEKKEEGEISMAFIDQVPRND